MSKYMETVKKLGKDIRRLKYLYRLSRTNYRFRPYRLLYKLELYTLKRQLNNLIF